LDRGHGELSTAQSSFGSGWSIPTVQPNSSRTTLQQLSMAITSNVATTPLAIAYAQGTGDGAHFFHERGSYVFDEFLSI
jgi:hypothetical protein